MYVNAVQYIKCDLGYGKILLGLNGFAMFGAAFFSWLHVLCQTAIIFGRMIYDTLSINT